MVTYEDDHAAARRVRAVRTPRDAVDAPTTAELARGAAEDRWVQQWRDDRYGGA